jgi:hypothetical protein
MDKLRVVSLALVFGLLSTQTFGDEPTVKPGTYVVSETFISIPSPFGFTPFEASFTGRFTFNPHGTGLCSALLCAPGVIPDFTNVSLSGTATNRVPWGPNVHGQIGVEEVGDVLTFVNLNGLPGVTSSTSFLDLTLTSSLGGPITNIATSEADYCAFGSACANITGTFMICGSADGNNNATCTGSVDIVGHMGPKTGAVIRSADSSVPEPATFSLLALAIVGLGVRGIRRQRADIAAA